MAVEFESLISLFNTFDAYEYLVELDLVLCGSAGESALDHNVVFLELNRLIKVFCDGEPDTTDKNKNKTQEAASSEAKETASEFSSALIKLLSRNLVCVLKKLPNKIYDTANNLLPFVTVDEHGGLSESGQAATIVLIDVFENFPHHLSSLVNFAATQLYKILKKNTSVDCNIGFLLSTVLKAALKTDIDEKFQAKWSKLLLKAITLHRIEVPDGESKVAEDHSEISIALLEYYIMSMKSVLTLQVTSNYQQLLEISASTSGSKMKPEAILSLQNQFQTSLLATHEKLFHFGLQSQFKEVRVAMVDLLANVLLSFVETGKFSPIEYLVDLYPVPNLNLWDRLLESNLSLETDNFFEPKKEFGLISNHDSQSIINSNANLLLLQIGCIETLVVYVQLASLQDGDFFPSYICKILDYTLSKFSDLSATTHLQNQQWTRTLDHWSTFVKFLVKEGGATIHEILATYIVEKFASSQDDLGSQEDLSTASMKALKRQSRIFSFKPSRKSKLKGPSSSVITPFHNPYQARLLLKVIALLLPFGIDFSSLAHRKSSDEDSIQDSQGEEANDELALPEEEDHITRKGSNFIRDLLFSLLANENEYIRNYSLQTLLRYGQINFSESNMLALTAFQMVNQMYNISETSKEVSESVKERNMTTSNSTKLLSYSLALLSLIKQSDSTVLQNSTIAKILSFCTQNLKHNSNVARKSIQNSVCWIILTALVTYYSDSEFVKLNSSQFLVFWKSLLTSQFITSDVTMASENGLLIEIVNNLKLRSLSIICLLNYINSVHLTSDLSKQLQFLLVKAHKYLLYLESNLEAIGGITAFNPQQFNESDYNPNMVNNLIFSNFSHSRSLTIEKQLISLILYNKKVVLQGFLRLSSSLKSDVNSSLVVLLLKIFADAKAFSRLPSTDPQKDKLKGGKNKVAPFIPAHEDKNILLLDEEYFYNFGVTSKFVSCFSKVDDLNCEFVDEQRQALFNCELFSIPSIARSEDVTESSGNETSVCWLDIFENGVHLPACHNVNYDPAVFLQQDYSSQNKYPTNLITSLVDLSIEVFQRVFPNLSFKIQFSLLEQLRTVLAAKTVDPLRKRALQVNISVALHGLVQNLVQSKLLLDEQLVNTIIQTLEHVQTPMHSLVSICADAIGLASALLSKQKSEELVSRYVNEIVGDTDPLKRGKVILCLSKICQYSQVGVSDTYNVISQLIIDPHPVISYYSISAACNVMENAIGNHSLSKEFIDMMHSKLLSTASELSLSNSVAPNLLATLNVMEKITYLLKLCITSLGPNLRESTVLLKQKLKHLVVSISYGIGCSNMSDYISSLQNLLGFLQEMIIFDSSFMPNFPQWFSNLCERLITTNMKTGVGLFCPTSVDYSAVFPFTTSQVLYDEAYSCIVEMTKLGLPTLDKQSLSIAWVSMELRPCPSLKSLISFWIDTENDIPWFTQLAALFKVSRKKLVGAFLAANYQHKLLPALQKRKKASEKTVDFQDEEIQNIVNEDSNVEEKNELINWEFKIFVYDMLIKIMTAAEKNPPLMQSLLSKIQEIVRMSFVGTASPILLVKLKGVELLDKALTLFGSMEDPLYPGSSILEQQQAQIISALIPCFGSDSDSTVMVNAINVSSKFVNLPRIKFYSKQRILNTLAFLLEEIASHKFLKFVSLEDMAEYGRKAVQLAILNCWAVLKINLEELETEPEPEFQQILDKYSTLLSSLWILALKDLSTIKYSQPNLKEIKLYSTYWLNFVGVLSLELEKNHSTMSDFLKEEEADFFFVLFCQCAESLIKNQSVSQVLPSVNRLLQVRELVNALFDDEIFGEVIDLLDRLVLMEEDTSVKCEVLDVVKTLFTSFLSINDTLQENEKSKLLELMRVAMLPLFEAFSFLNQDFNVEEAQQQSELSQYKSPSNFILLKKLLSVSVSMVEAFKDHTEKEALFSCLLYIFAKFYEHGDDILVGMILPFLKIVISDSFTLSGLKLPVLFYNVLRHSENFQPGDSKVNHIITMMILLTSGSVELDTEEVDLFSASLVLSLANPETAPTAIHSIKSLIKNLLPSASGSTRIIRSIVKILLKDLLLEEEPKIDQKLALEIVFLVSQSAAVDTVEKRISMYAVLLPLIVKFDELGSIDRQYLHDKVFALLNSDPNAFKAVVNEHLSEEHKRAAEALVKFKQNASSSLDPEEDGIALKTFS